MVVAGGSGQRFGAAKQFCELGGLRVLERAVATAASVCDGVVVVLAPDVIGTDDGSVQGASIVVAGGTTRGESSRAGVDAVPPAAEIILVHDAARPLASSDLFARVISAVRDGADAVVPVVPVIDTIRDPAGAVVDRSRLRAVQTPQGFSAECLRVALGSAQVGGSTVADPTDDAAVVQAAGTEVQMVQGERENLKLTTSLDLVVAEALLGIAEAAGTGSGRPSIDTEEKR